MPVAPNRQSTPSALKGLNCQVASEMPSVVLKFSVSKCLNCQIPLEDAQYFAVITTIEAENGFC